MATPARQVFTFVIQDNRGFKSLVKIVGFDADISSNSSLISANFTEAAAIGTAIAAMTNAKVVETGFGFDFDIAQEPSTETGTYQLVIEKAHMQFGDGNTLKEFISIPAPKDGLFLTSGQDNLIVVNPASSLVTGLQSATSSVPTASGGTWGAQFFGGQLRSAKPRRRRVLQGA